MTRNDDVVFERRAVAQPLNEADAAIEAVCGVVQPDIGVVSGSGKPGSQRGSGRSHQPASPIRIRIAHNES